MNVATDTRLGLLFGTAADAGPQDALLLEGRGADAPGRAWFTVTAPHAPLHTGGCACCAPRNEAGQALARLWLGRARGEGPFFARVVAVTATAAGRDAVVSALAADPLASACFRRLSQPAA
jgi:hypothetical protein